MSLKYEELFKATLSMFALDASGGPSSFKELKPQTIQLVFKKVLKANQLCFEDYKKAQKSPQIH